MVIGPWNGVNVLEVHEWCPRRASKEMEEECGGPEEGYVWQQHVDLMKAPECCCCESGIFAWGAGNR